MPHTNIDSIFKGIAQAVKDAQVHIEHYSVERFSSYFEEEKQEKDGTSILRPKMVRMPMPNAKGEYIERDIPIITLMNHHALNLDEVKLKMQVSGSWDDKSNKLQVNVEPIRHKTDSDKGKEVAYTEIELVFRRADAAEGVCRTLKEHYKRMP
jgi:hypothetical protein